MCSLPLASLHSTVWSVSSSVSWSPSPSFWFCLTLWGWAHAIRVVHVRTVFWCWSSALSQHRHPLHNHLTAAVSKGSGCPDAWEDSCLQLASAGLVRFCVSIFLCMKDGWAFVLKHFLVFTPPYSAQKGGNSSLLTRVVFPVGWLAIQQSPQECRKSDPKSPGTKKRKFAYKLWDETKT